MFHAKRVTNAVLQVKPMRLLLRTLLEQTASRASTVTREPEFARSYYSWSFMSDSFESQFTVNYQLATAKGKMHRRETRSLGEAS